MAVSGVAVSGVAVSGVAVSGVVSGMASAGSAASGRQAGIIMFTQPLAATQESAVQTLLSSQLRAAPGTQAPAVHTSVTVHMLPSSQAVPSALAGLEQTPVVVSQVPATWHWSEGMQATGFMPVQTPVWQLSCWVQALLSLQLVPSAFSG